MQRVPKAGVPRRPLNSGVCIGRRPNRSGQKKSWSRRLSRATASDNTPNCAFFRDGQAQGTLIVRRLRQHPREFGRAATYVETTEVAEVAELSERFLRAINYYGLVEIEFKQDQRDGQFKLLDVNARTWGFHSLGAAAGVDFPYLLYADQVRESIERSAAQAGVGWLRLITDLPTVASGLWDGELSLGSYWDSLRRTGVESVFCAQDVLPSLAELFLLPYLVTNEYLVKSSTHTAPQTKGSRVSPQVSVNESWYGSRSPGVDCLRAGFAC